MIDTHEVHASEWNKGRCGDATAQVRASPRFSQCEGIPLPGRISALGAFGVAGASQGSANNLTFGDARYQYYETTAGGSGGGRDYNGASATHVHMTNTRLTDPEVLEWRFPVLLEKFSIRAGSGGASAHPGGNGVIRRVRFLEPSSRRQAEAGIGR